MHVSVAEQGLRPIFELRDARVLFQLLEITLDHYESASAKSTKDAMFLLFGLCHLREWIAPGFKFDGRAKPLTAEERFGVALFQHCACFRQMLDVWNGAKHRSGGAGQTGVTYGLDLDQRDTSVDDWLDFDQGPASDFEIDGRPLASILGPVLGFYRTWFDGSFAHPESSTAAIGQSDGSISSNTAFPHCVGVDGAKDGWLAVWEGKEGLEFKVYASAQSLCEAHPDAVIAVDIPLGLSDHGPRAADEAARRLVGSRRASSIFSSPVRGILDARSQPEASTRHRVIDGRGFGAQSFAILSKIREWNDLLLASPEARGRVHEIHPEVSFALLNQRTGIASPKKTEDGALLRRELLVREFGHDRVEFLMAACRHPKVSRDDVLDAMVALWSARRIATGVAESFPAQPTLDSAGIPVVIRA